MMKRTITAFVMLFVIAGQAVCYADGNKLLSQCKAAIDRSSTAYQDASFCMGFLNGMTSTVSVMHTALNVPRPFCLPDKIPTGQGVRVVIKYLEKHPELLHYDDGSLAMLAFMEAFPCMEK